jgi:hypothetical protein
MISENMRALLLENCNKKRNFEMNLKSEAYTHLDDIGSSTQHGD